MLHCQKDLFYLPDDLHYLNCAYMSPMSRPVESAGIEGIRSKRVPATIQPDDFFAPSDQVRQHFARLVNIPDPGHIALIPSVSYGIATVARNTPLGPGENIVVVEEQFPSNVYSWLRLQETTRATVRTVIAPDLPGSRGAAWSQRLLEAIDARTALVALPHVHWADGTRFDLERIGQRAREVGAAFVIDGTQSVGAFPFDVAMLQPDALIVAGYKWLFGPYSIGMAYYGPRYREGIPIEENWITRRGSEHFSGLVNYEADYQPGAIRYDVGERSNFILVPMMSAGLALVQSWGVAAIQTYCQTLTREILTEARSMGFQVEDESWRGAHLFGIRVPPQISMDRLREALQQRNVSVSVRGNAIRIAPHVYNDAADIEALHDALRASHQ